VRERLACCSQPAGRSSPPDRACSLLTLLGSWGLCVAACRVCALRKADPDAGPLFVKMMTLCVQLLQSAELTERAVNGVWATLQYSLQGPPAMVCPAALELGVVELAASQLHKLGTAADLLVRPDHSTHML
jgi:hypothetical protein